MALELPNTDKRVARRSRVLKQGKIVFNNLQSVFDCTIRDMSETGAKLVCIHQNSVPSECRLVIIMDNTIRDCQVMWRKGDQLGVHFTSEAKRAPLVKW